MITKQVRFSVQSKDRMSRLKGRTGIKNWNVLARWAFCYSLKEGTVPAEIDIEYDGGVEMSWFTFAGEFGDVYEMLLVRWCRENDLDTDEETLSKYFSLHLERGVGYLSGTHFIRSVDDLLSLGFEEEGTH